MNGERGVHRHFELNVQGDLEPGTEPEIVRSLAALERVQVDHHDGGIVRDVVIFAGVDLFLGILVGLAAGWLIWGHS